MCCTAQIESDRNISFDKKPEMKAVEITQAGVAALKSGLYNQVRIRASGFGVPLVSFQKMLSKDA